MSNRTVKTLLLACSGVAALICATADANAGGFAIREQSAYGQGSSFAGIAAGGALSSMFWNPATMTQVPGVQSESVYTGILPYASNPVGAGSTLTALGYGGTSNIAPNELVPAGYMSMQLKPDLWIGMSVNSPFGLAVTFPDQWAGRDYATGATNLKTYNAAPSIAYRLSDMISVAIGAQIEYAKADLSRGPTPFVAPPGAFFPVYTELSGSGWAYGFTAGVTLTPTPTTTIGIGYRSALNQKINGTLIQTGAVALPGTTNGSASTTIDLPDVVSVGLRQRLGAQWTLLGTFEWSNWSRIGTSNVVQGNGAAATVGGTAVTIPFQYSDGYFYSLGAEYQWNDKVALRAGAGYEKSPITDGVRIPALPDNDRTWVSIGASYKYSNKISFDAAYSHLFVKNTPINISAASGNPSFDGITYNGTIDAHIDIVSIGMHYRWDEPPAPATSKLYHK